jgi:hypothetical protein
VKAALETTGPRGKGDLPQATELVGILFSGLVLWSVLRTPQADADRHNRRAQANRRDTQRGEHFATASASTTITKYLREGDTLIVWRLDRLGRNMRSIINTLHELTERGVTLRSLHDGVDTSTSTGRMVTGILMSIAEYERGLVRERTALKLEHA